MAHEASWEVHEGTFMHSSSIIIDRDFMEFSSHLRVYSFHNCSGILLLCGKETALAFPSFTQHSRCFTFVSLSVVNLNVNIAFKSKICINIVDCLFHACYHHQAHALQSYSCFRILVAPKVIIGCYLNL